MKRIILFTTIALLTFNVFAKADRKLLADINIFKEAYPDLTFKVNYDKKLSDYRVEITFPEKSEPKVFYWCDGKLLPEEELSNKDNYLSIFYSYPDELKDPTTMTEEEKELLKNYSSRQSRKSTVGTSMFFFDELYNSTSKKAISPYIKNVKFLTVKTNIHKRIETPLKNVETKINALAKTNDEVKKFVDGLKSADAYNWRLIDGTPRKSFHSLGIAVDVIPKRITGEIFWSWAKDHNPSGWMLLPLTKRWLPPMEVVKIFEEEGFIWGGKWAIWDNMHFEYHPEILLWNKEHK